MRAIPLRVRITALVLITAISAVLLAIVLGGVETVDESIATTTLESTSTALQETSAQLTAYGDDVKARIRDRGTEDSGEPFDGWDEVPGLNRAVLNDQLDPATLDLSGSISISATHKCTATPGTVSCNSQAPDLPSWAVAEIERRAERAANGDVPVAVHGFTVTNESGTELLIRLDNDIFAATEVELSSGIADLAVIAVPLLLLTLGAATWFSLGQVLSPVALMIDQVDRIGAENLDQRVPVPKPDDELKHLAVTMNQMLDRLQRSSDSQRQFISDASHELRSPITATGATLEVARSNPDETDWEQVAAVVEEENARLARLVDDLLLLARLDEEGLGQGDAPSPGGASAVDLEEVCLAEADRPHPVTVTVRVLAPARVDGSLSALTRAVRNLVDNAAAHADSAVVLEVDSSDETALVRVIDDGAGVPPEYTEKIFERFVRVDESRARTTGGGAGLGLAIARRVAQSHGGSLKLVESQAKGATFELSLPLAT